MTLLQFLLAPASCVLCGKDQAPLCSECVAELPRFERVAKMKCCQLCGLPLFAENGLCMKCRERSDIALDGNHSLYLYQGSGKKIMLLYKIEGKVELAWWFAAQIATFFVNNYSNSTLIPIPPRHGKIHKNGWDQVALISGILKRKYHLPIISPLKRSDNIQQKSLSREERFTHLQQTLTCCNKTPLPQRVVLFDDVYTTGATFNAAAELLKANGVKDVQGLSIVINP